MRFTSLLASGIVAFPGEVSLDIESLPGPLVAITGPNGAGKSTMLELLIGAAVPGRKCPTRGPLTSLAATRDAHVRVGVVNGKPWTIEHRLDGVSGKSETDVIGADGAPALPDKKVRSFDDWARKTLPAPEVLLSSIFCAQKDGGFLGMSAGDRKAVVLRLRGVERLEKLAEAARAHAREAKAALDTIEARIKDERVRGGGDVDKAQADLDEVRTALAAAEASKAEADAALATARAEAARAKDHNDGVREKQAAIAAAERGRDDAQRRVNALTSEIAGLRYGLLEQAEDIRSAAARVEALDREIAPLRERLAGLRAEQQAADARLTVARQTAERTRAASAHAAAKLPEIEARAVARTKAAEEAAHLSEERAKLESAKADEEAAQALLDELTALERTGHLSRLTDLRTALEWYADGDNYEADQVGEPQEEELAPVLADQGGCARDALGADDAVKRRLASLPEDSKAALEARRAARAEVDGRRERVRHLEQQKALAETPDPLPEYKQAASEAREAFDAALVAEQDAKADDERLRKAIVEATAALNERTAERGKLSELAAKTTELAQGEARLQALSEQLAEAERDAGVCAEAIEELTRAAPALKSEPDMGPKEQACHQAVAAAVSAGARVSDAERALTAARESAERLEALERDRVALAEDLADWTRLGADLGRDGLQAHLVDATGPELTAIANDLLHTCIGTRFTVEIATQYADASGKKMLEGCEVRVLDTRDGRWKLGEQLSGGEAVVVGESISLALATLACRIWGIEGVTLVRDESGAALDVDAAPAYVAMLRRAAEAIGASKVLFVSHNPAAAALADARVVVGGGKVEVQA